MKKLKIAATAVSALLFANNSMAMNIDWSGVYRVEAVEVARPSLASPQNDKYYGLNYLSLSPKIIASDGVNVISRFDILGQETGAYADSQVGQIWGSNNNVGSTTVTVPNNSSTAGVSGRSNQGSSNVRVRELYLNLNQEYGALIVGRAPFHFGLGMSYNSGTGLFDHWYDTRDMFAYKFIVSDWSFTPILSRVYSESPALGNSVNEMAFNLQYENKETRSILGVIQNTRKGANSVNDSSAVAYGGDVTKTISDLNIQQTNFYLGRDWDSFGFKLEAGFITGTTGYLSSTGDDVRVNAYGIVSELYFPRLDSKWEYNMKVGIASGDNPNTSAYEGFQFDKNYDVAMLLFNHRLGQKDFLSTNLVKNTSLTTATSVDDETVGNAMFISPTVGYAWNDRLDLKNTFTYAQLINTQKNSVDAKKDLGLEWDISLIYKATDKIQWVNQVGMLLPGSAFKNGSDQLTNGFVYGLTSKAAISF